MRVVEVSAAAIVREGRLFATRRGYGEFEGWWEFPGGKVEPGETPEEALVREIREELGAEVAPERLLATVEYDYPAFHLTMHVFVCRQVAGELHLLEHSAARWVDAPAARELRWLPADAPALDALVEQGLVR